MEIGREPSPASGAPLGGERRWQRLAILDDVGEVKPLFVEPSS